MSKQPLTQAEFDSIYSIVPRVNVELIVFTDQADQADQAIVLSKRSIEPCIGQWHIPGGTVYFGETIEEAAHRVAKDELGVEVRIHQQVGIIQYPILCKNEYNGWPIGIAIEVSIVSGNLRGSYQGEEVSFFSEVPDKLIEDQKNFLLKAYPKL